MRVRVRSREKVKVNVFQLNSIDVLADAGVLEMLLYFFLYGFAGLLIAHCSLLSVHFTATSTVGVLLFFLLGFVFVVVFFSRSFFVPFLWLFRWSDVCFGMVQFSLNFLLANNKDVICFYMFYRVGRIANTANEQNKCAI